MYILAAISTGCSIPDLEWTFFGGTLHGIWGASICWIAASLGIFASCKPTRALVSSYFAMVCKINPEHLYQLDKSRAFHLAFSVRCHYTALLYTIFPLIFLQLLHIILKLYKFRVFIISKKTYLVNNFP